MLLLLDPRQRGGPSSVSSFTPCQFTALIGLLRTKAGGRVQILIPGLTAIQVIGKVEFEHSRVVSNEIIMSLAVPPDSLCSGL